MIILIIGSNLRLTQPRLIGTNADIGREDYAVVWGTLCYKYCSTLQHTTHQEEIKESNILLGAQHEI